MKSFKGFVSEATLDRGELAKRPARPAMFAKKIWSGTKIETEKGSDIIIKKLEMGGNEYDASKSSDEQRFLDDFENLNPRGQGLKITDPKTSWNNITKSADYGGKAGKGPTGADWESIITHQLNKLLDKEKSDTDAITIASKYYPEYEALGVKIAKSFREEFGDNTMTQYGGGGGKTNLSKSWTKHGGTNATPKTDMYTSSYNVSLKKKGGSQLASGGKGETLATFYAALEYLGESKDNKEGISNIMDAIKNNFEQVALEYSKSDLDDITSGKKNVNLSSSDKKELAKFTETEKFHKDLNIKLQDVMKLEENKDFMKWYVFEAMSGFKKFKDKKSIASVCVTFDAERGGLEKINVTSDGGSSGLKVNNASKIKLSQELITKSEKIKVYSAWKSSGSKPYSVLRLSNYDPINPDIVPLVDCTFNDIIREELQNDIEANNVVKTLQEELVMLDEFALIKKVFNKMKSVGKSALDWVQGFFKRVMAKVGKVFESIKKLGAKMFEGLFEFLGIEITSVKETVPKDLHGFIYGMAD